MAIIKVITPSNLGKTIQLGALESNKWDVKLKPTHLENTELGIGLVDSLISDLKAAGLKNAELVGTELKLTKQDDSELKVDLASLIPAAKADHFLKSVTYESATKELVFTVGAEGTEEGQTVSRVNVSDLVPVTVGNGLEGNGTAESPLKVKLATGPLKTSEEGLGFNVESLAELVDGTGEVSLGYIMPKAAFGVRGNSGI